MVIVVVLVVIIVEFIIIVEVVFFVLVVVVLVIIVGKVFWMVGQYCYDQVNYVGQVIGQQGGGEQECCYGCVSVVEQVMQWVWYVCEYVVQDVVGEYIDEQCQKLGIVVGIWFVFMMVIDWCWQCFVIDQFDQYGGGIGDVFGVVVGVEVWYQVFLDDLVGDGIGNCVFQVVIWFDLYVLVFFGYYQQYVVIYVFVVDLLLVEDLCGVLCDVFWLGGGYYQYLQLVVFVLLQVQCLLYQCLFLCSIQCVGGIDYW